MLLDLNQRVRHRKYQPTDVKYYESRYFQWRFHLEILGLGLLVVYPQEKGGPHVEQEKEEIPNEESVDEWSKFGNKLRNGVGPQDGYEVQLVVEQQSQPGKHVHEPLLHRYSFLGQFQYIRTVLDKHQQRYNEEYHSENYGVDRESRKDDLSLMLYSMYL